MSYNDYINNLRLNNSIGYIINNQNIMFDMVTSLRNSINNSNRSRSSRPNYYSYRNTMPTTPSPPSSMNYNTTRSNTTQSNTTPTSSTDESPQIFNRLRNIEISLTEPFTSQLFNSVFNTAETETPPLTISNLLENTELMLYNSSDNTDIDSMCTVCRLDIQNNSIVRKINGCGHVFHHSCLDNWLKNNHTCPVCRHSLRDTSERPTNTRSDRATGSVL